MKFKPVHDDNVVIWMLNTAIVKIATKLGVALVLLSIEHWPHQTLNATEVVVILSSSLNRSASKLRSSSEFIPNIKKKEKKTHISQLTHNKLRIEERH